MKEVVFVIAVAGFAIVYCVRAMLVRGLLQNKSVVMLCFLDHKDEMKKQKQVFVHQNCVVDILKCTTSY